MLCAASICLESFRTKWQLRMHVLKIAFEDLLKFRKNNKENVVSLSTENLKIRNLMQ